MAETLEDASASARHVLHNLGFFGHYLHVNAGGLSGQQHMLVKLRRHGGHMTPRELPECSRIKSASLSEVLSKLECAQLIERTRSEDDRRQLDIALTEKGAHIADELIEQRESFDRQCLACLSEQEQQQLSDMLDRLVEHWKTISWEDILGKGVCA